MIRHVVENLKKGMKPQKKWHNFDHSKQIIVNPILLNNDINRPKRVDTHLNAPNESCAAQAR